MIHINFTAQQWTDFSLPFWSNEPPKIIYNATEFTSQYAAPIWQDCATSLYIGYEMTHVDLLQYPSVNDYFLSMLDNFFSNIVAFASYYNLYIEAYAVNDVLIKTFYFGKMTRIVLDFDTYKLKLEDNQEDWETYYPYVPPNKRDRQYYLDRGLDVPDHLKVPNTNTKARFV